MCYLRQIDGVLGIVNNKLKEVTRFRSLNRVDTNDFDGFCQDACKFYREPKMRQTNFA